MSTPIPYLMQGKNIILVVDGKSHTVSKDTHIGYAKIVEALKAQDWDALHDLLEPKKAIVNFGKGFVSMNEKNEVLWKGKTWHNALSSRMIEMFTDGFPIDPMVRFMENLMENPSKRSVEQMYTFLERNKLPITEDGHFLAFKRVRDDYKDIHSGTIDNSIGQVVTMDRNEVDDDPNSYCSSGLHFCSESYLGSFGSSHQPVMILKINPADVVSIPNDYNGAKGRACRYEVIDQVKGAAKDCFAGAVFKDPAAKKATPVKKFTGEDGPTGAWPFPKAVKAPPAAPAVTVSDDENGPYDVFRQTSGDFVATVETLAEAQELVAKNVRQKKAKLFIQDGDGNEVE